MFAVSYAVSESRIPGAGKGIFLQETVRPGAVIVSPDKIHRVYSLKERQQFPAGSIEEASSVRWFERRFTTCPEWSDECFINHSFSPNGLWHLGFVFAKRQINSGEELTVDYRFLIDDGEVLPFKDAESGTDIIGLSWDQNLRQSTESLLSLLH